MHDAVAGFGLALVVGDAGAALVVGDAGAALVALVSSAAERMGGGRWT
ncbi:MAG: hypothetical protein M3Q60_15585 [Actinomycetota bacterium]|jgi:hypothetical protein|nr:hypothetical protein [Actinomycetota bacterium]